MRIVRVLVIALLATSIAANIFMYLRWRHTRPIMTINGENVTEKMVFDRLQQEKGPIVKKEITERILIDQEAKKAGLIPTQAEIDQLFTEQKEMNPRFAQDMATNPWLEQEAKDQIRMTLEQLRLRAKDIPVTDDEMKAEYAAHPVNYDTPSKAHVELGVIMDASHADEIQQLLEKNIAPADIMRNYPGAVNFPGDHYRYTFQQPVNTKENEEVFKMKPGDTKRLKVGDSEAAQGVKVLIARMIDIVPGHKYDPNNARDKDRLRMALASRRMKPLQEWLSDVWANTHITTDDPNDKQYIEMMMFPDRRPGFTRNDMSSSPSDNATPQALR